ncbi:sporulation integral membrane protein YtvI [Paenibacillus albiflavus]|uniref:Sporulation integral membrane protein YtvI n=1 Tax=Paenibacillus albiflavus TaxID=2545760 RepID=A0A4R4EAM0_9BACL|nr:sporulation integral membrane protein YtvI [Paenibacillus albiflavus]TCZ76143.1 sporulation integral membrane protein YtvI [Paenibacillus albiflavus]
MSLRTAISMVVGILLLYAMFTVGLPFLLALITAISLESITLLLIKHLRVNRFAAGTIVSTLFTLVMLLLFYVIGFKIVREVIDFWNLAPHYLEEATNYLDAALEQTRSFYESLPPEIADRLRSWLESTAQELPNTVAGIVKTVSAYLAGTIPNLFVFVTVFIIAVYLFTYSLPSLKQSIIKLFDVGSRDKVDKVMVNLRTAIFGFLQSQIILAIITYIFTFLGLLLLKTEYPLAIALLVTIMEFAPIIGTGLVFIPWALYHFILGNVGYGVGILILFIVGATMRRIIEPKILSDTVGISALAALVSLYVGYELMGFMGVFIGPFVVIIYQTLRHSGLLKMNIRLDDD